MADADVHKRMFMGKFIWHKCPFVPLFCCILYIFRYMYICLLNVCMSVGKVFSKYSGRQMYNNTATTIIAKNVFILFVVVVRSIYPSCVVCVDILPPLFW